MWQLIEGVECHSDNAEEMTEDEMAALKKKNDQVHLFHSRFLVTH